MSTVYQVELKVDQSGNLVGTIQSTISALGAADTAVNKFSSSMKDGVAAAADKFTGLVETIGAVAVGFASMGAAFAASKIHEGIVSLNAELESTRLSMASIFYNTGATTSFNDGLALAGNQLDKMRQDAKRLPGEFSDLALIMRTIAAPAGNAGLSADKTREMAAQFMAAGSVANLPMAMVAREAAMLMGGRAGGHNVLGMQAFGLAGSKAHEFNAMGQDKQIEFLTTKLAMFKPAIDSYANSFTGLTSTLSDNLHIATQFMTAPLFEKVKATLSDINQWFESNQTTISYWGFTIGRELANAWDWGIQKAKDWGPLMLNFALDIKTTLLSTWEAIEPVVSHVADMIHSSLGDGSAMENVKQILKLYAAVKIGGGAVTSSVGLGETVLSKYLLGTGAAGAAGAAGAGVIGASGLVAAGMAAAALAVAATGAAGELSALTNFGSTNHADAVTAANRLTSAFGNLERSLSVSVLPALERFGVASTNFLSEVVNGLRDITDSHNAKYFRTPGAKNSAHRGIFDQWIEDQDVHLNPDEPIPIDRVPQLGPMMKAIGIRQVPDEPKKVTPKPPNVTVNAKVQITVTSNQDPMRIARMVKTEFLSEMRHPKFSGAPNFMNPR